MTIKINNVLVDSEVLPISKPTLDETLETFSFALKSETNDVAYAPMQKVEITTDDNEKINLLIVSDNVEIFSLNPTCYKHNITCIENTRELSKYVVRNSVFTQPATNIRKGFYNLSAQLGQRQSGDYANFVNSRSYRSPDSATPFSHSNNYKHLVLETNEKILRFYVKFKLNAVKNSAGSYYSGQWIENIRTFADLDFTSGDFRVAYDSAVIIKYTDKNNTTKSFSLTSMIASVPNNAEVFNVLLPIPDEYLQQIIEDEGNDFYIDGNYIKGQFVNNTTQSTFFSGTQYPENEDYISFFNFSIQIFAETYNYTAYDILDLLLRRQRQIYSTENRTYAKNYLFDLPEEGELYDLLKSTIAPNFTFTQLTFYECVAEVFRLFDSIFTIDSDGVLGITYFNQANKTVKNLDFSGVNIALSEDKYTNALQTYYQDARSKVQFPNHKGYANLRSSQLGVPEQGDHHFITPHNIYYVDEAYVLATKVHAPIGYPNSYGYESTLLIEGNLELDITDFVIEESLWSLLSTTSTKQEVNPQNKVQNNTICYAQGDNKIKCAYTSKTSWGVQYYSFGNMLDCVWWLMNGWSIVNVSQNHSVDLPADGDWKSIKMRTKYTTTIDGIEKVHSLVDKTDGETLIDQSNGAVDLNKLGLNILGLTLKLGEPSLNATQNLTTWTNRVKIGDVIEYQGDRWIANVVAYNLLGNGYLQTKITFVKNFNALALRTRLWREKRLSNISSSLTQKSEDVISNFIYFAGQSGIHGTMPGGFQGQRTEIGFVESYLAQSLYLSFVQDFSVDLTIDFAGMLNYLGNKFIYMPLIIYGAGNTINFEMSFDNPMSAGYKTTYSTVSTWWGEKKYYTETVNYTNEYGYMDNCSIRLFSAKDLEFSETFPDITSDLSNAEPSPKSLLVINDYYPYKQPNEIFALNYQLVFLGYKHDRDFIGNAFINDNFFVNGVQKARKLKFFYSTSSSDKYNVLDTKGLGNSVDVSSIDYRYHEEDVVSQNYIEIRFTMNDLVENNIDSYAICDENNNILFAFNRPTWIFNQRISIFFKARHSRK